MGLLSFFQTIVKGFRDHHGRLRSTAQRLQYLELRLALLERRGVLISDPHALRAVPGSPLMPQEHILVVRIEEKDLSRPNDKVYRATVQKPTALGVFEDDDDDGEPRTVMVRAYPRYPEEGAGEPKYASLPIGALVAVRWDGRDDQDDFYHVLAAPGGSDVTQFRVKQVKADHLVCREWDGETEGDEEVLVAKPYLLRKTPFDGQTIDHIQYTYIGAEAVQRQAQRDTNPNDLEVQQVHPSWLVAVGSYLGDLIYATKPVNGTDVIVDGETLEWLDLNIDARKWSVS